MPRLIALKTLSDGRGALSVLDQDLPFSPRRVFFLHHLAPDAVRGGHRHKRNRQVLVCVSGSCEVAVRNREGERSIPLDAPDKGLLLEPEDWHLLRRFSPDAILLVLASEPYDPDDYIREGSP